MSKRGILVITMAAVLAVTGTAVVSAQQDLDVKNGPNNPREFGAPLTRPTAPQVAFRQNPEAFGTIIYDDGIVTALPAVTSNCYGNQYDTANGNPVTAAGSVTQMSFFIISGAGTDNVFVSVFDQVSGTAAPVLTSVSVPLNNGSSAFNTHTFATPVSYAGASFLAGVWYIGGDTVGLGSGTVNGQGHHGMLINDIVGTGFTTLPGLNALVGASGDLVIPVELMGFTVE